LLSIQQGWIKGPSSKKIIGHVLHVVGETSVDRGFIHVALMPHMGIKEDDDLLTGRGAAVWMTFSDGTLVRLGENSRLHLGAHQFANEKLLQLARGHLYCEVQPQPHPMTVETPRQIIEVMGTRFSLRVEKEHVEKLRLFEGHLSIKAHQTAEVFTLEGGESLNLREGVFSKDELRKNVVLATFESYDAEQNICSLTQQGHKLEAELPYSFDGEKATRNAELLHKMQQLVRGDKVNCLLENNDMNILRQIEKAGNPIE
jgi:hypothetical protein